LLGIRIFFFWGGGGICHPNLRPKLRVPSILRSTLTPHMAWYC